MDIRKFIHRIYLGFLNRPPEAGATEQWIAAIKSGMSLDQVTDAFLHSDEFEARQKQKGLLWVAPGHFYSPIVNTEEVRNLFTKNRNPDSLAALTLDKEGQLGIWRRLLPYLHEIPFPEEKQGGFRYYYKNPSFSYGDGSILYAMLRAYRPRRLIEIGSGYSSACAIDTIDIFLGGEVEVAFIEPYPQLLFSLLEEERLSSCTIYPCGVQAASLEAFDTLESGDFLFIDSTHVLKTGSDVCHELFEILPRLKRGVLIHIHDVFWPFEYPASWVIDEKRSWNEIYALRAFLMYNEAFEIVFFNDYFVKSFESLVSRDYPAMLKNSGGSIWLRKIT